MPQGIVMELKVPAEVQGLARRIDEVIEGQNTATICAALALILNRVLPRIVQTPDEYWAVEHMPIGEWVVFAVKDGGGEVQELNQQ